jgi:AbrB family transcriptional regulator (stage V sporulation protein T)
MKATGIVRRIDELGRVVIPKEIRRTQRIRQGDPLEIFTTGEGEVIFKKYSPVGGMAASAEQYAAVLAKSLGVPAFVCDRDNILAAGGAGRRDVLDKHISAPLEKLAEGRRTYEHPADAAECLFPCEGCPRHILAAAPILAAGDVIGAVGLLGEDRAAGPAPEQVKAVEIAAAFLAKQMEE